MRMFFLFCACLGIVIPRAAQGGEAEVVRIGICLPLTGGLSESGLSALAGARMRKDEFNAKSGVTGFRIELVVRDDESDPELAVKIARELAEEGVPALIGPLTTNAMLAMRDTAREYGMVMISPSVTSPLIGVDRDWAVRVLYDDAFQGVVLAHFLCGRPGSQTAATVENTRFAYSASVADAFAECFTGEGGRMMVREKFSWSLTEEDHEYDFTAILENLQRLDPDVVLLPLNSPEVSTLIFQAADYDLKALFCGGDTWQYKLVTLASGNRVEGSYFVSGLDLEADTPAMRRFREAYENSHDPDAQPTSVLTYDAMSLLIEALKTGRDGRSIREGLYAIRDFPLASGTVTIDPVRGTLKTAYIHSIIKTDNGFETRVVQSIEP